MLSLRKLTTDDKQALEDAYGGGEHILNATKEREALGSYKFCGFVNGIIVGGLTIRINLAAEQLIYDGHVGYSVIPTYHKNGYATEMLRQALPICKTMGLDKVLLTCYDTNIASIRVIEKNGGTLNGKVIDENGQTFRQYWFGAI